MAGPSQPVSSTKSVVLDDQGNEVGHLTVKNEQVTLECNGGFLALEDQSGHRFAVFQGNDLFIQQFNVAAKLAELDRRVKVLEGG